MSEEHLLDGDQVVMDADDISNPDEVRKFNRSLERLFSLGGEVAQSLKQSIRYLTPRQMDLVKTLVDKRLKDVHKSWFSLTNKHRLEAVFPNLTLTDAADMIQMLRESGIENKESLAAYIAQAEGDSDLVNSLSLTLECNRGMLCEGVDRVKESYHVLEKVRETLDCETDSVLSKIQNLQLLVPPEDDGTTRLVVAVHSEGEEENDQRGTFPSERTPEQDLNRTLQFSTPSNSLFRRPLRF